VGCKGCKRDCPTGVDMAKMKLEATARRTAERGARLLDRLVARLPDFAPLASRAPWLFNLRDRLPGAAWLGERLLGLSARRSLPRFRRDTFAAVAPGLGLVSHVDVLAAPKGVVLFVDTFNGHFETENARDAVRVLQAAGYAVHVPRQRDGRAPCCGRTFLAAGLADEARARAQALIETFTPFVDAGLAIVGLEPSCLLSLRDELLVMGLGEPAQRLSRQALLFEEFLDRERQAGRLSLPLRPATQPLLVHGHCHQKAFGVMPPVLSVLRLIPGAEVSVIESSCCGMAGAFGFEAAHHDVSMQMAELSLLPAVRARADAMIVADGTSCRHQIGDGTQREAWHVARVLAAHLES
jgi:Fe-S oxidoreductase